MHLWAGDAAWMKNVCQWDNIFRTVWNISDSKGLILYMGISMPNLLPQSLTYYFTFSVRLGIPAVAIFMHCQVFLTCCNLTFIFLHLLSQIFINWSQSVQKSFIQILIAKTSAYIMYIGQVETDRETPLKLTHKLDVLGKH